jgi:predicted transcriptional regulator
VKASFLLAQATSSARVAWKPSGAPALRMSDPALRAVTDFLQEPPLTVSEHVSLDEAVSHFAGSAVYACLVVRDRAVVGLMNAFAATRLVRLRLRVADVMTPTDEIPVIGWDTVAEVRVADLIEIFDGARVHDLAVLESHSATLTSMRGLISRERLARQLR